MNLRLKEARLRKGLSQNELADLAHITRQAYSLYERDLRRPNWETMIVLAKALGVTVDYLLGLTEDPFPAIPMDIRDREMVRAYHLLDERGKDMIDITLKEQSRYAAAEDGTDQDSR